MWRPRLLQELHEDDSDRRMQFCEEFGALFNYRDVIWTDEAKFSLDGSVNRHNCVYYAEENPHQIFKRSVNSPGIMVWAGICPIKVIGPYFFTKSVTAATYLNMLENFAFTEIDRLKEEIGEQCDLWWQQDGAPPHFAINVRQRLDQKFPGKWIGRRGPVEWPPRSPDLSPMDYGVWGIIKEKVFRQENSNLQMLEISIREAFQSFDRDLCSKICDSLPQRISQCMNEDGGHFENKRT